MSKICPSSVRWTLAAIADTFTTQISQTQFHELADDVKVRDHDDVMLAHYIIIFLHSNDLVRMLKYCMLERDR